MPISPLPNTNALWNEVNALVSRATEYVERDMEVRKLLKRVEALKNADVGSAFLLLGTIYQLSGDVAGMRDEFRKAAPYVSQFLHNVSFSASLMNMGYFTEAQAYTRVTTDPRKGQFAKTIKHGIATGIFTTLAAHLETADRMNLEVADEIRDKVAKAFAITEHFEIDEQAIGSTLDLVGDVLRANRLIYLGEPDITVWGFNEHQDVEPHICFEFAVARSALQIATLRSELSAKIAESALGHFPAGIVVRIVPAEHGNTFALAA